MFDGLVQTQEAWHSVSYELSREAIAISSQDARRLVVARQHLARKPPAKPTREYILSVVRDLTFVQWDPIAVVAPSHVLSLWNRVGDFPLADLEKLLWDEKKLFLHWVNFAASLELTEDYPLYYSMMKRYPESIGKSWGSRKPNTRLTSAFQFFGGAGGCQVSVALLIGTVPTTLIRTRICIVNSATPRSQKPGAPLSRTVTAIPDTAAGRKKAGTSWRSLHTIA